MTVEDANGCCLRGTGRTQCGDLLERWRQWGKPRKLLANPLKGRIPRSIGSSTLNTLPMLRLRAALGICKATSLGRNDGRLTPPN